MAHYVYVRCRRHRIPCLPGHGPLLQCRYTTLSRRVWTKHFVVHACKYLLSFSCESRWAYANLMYNSGLIPTQDAPDIIANTFLEQVSDTQLFNIRFGFLDHRERKASCSYLVLSGSLILYVQSP